MADFAAVLKKTLEGLGDSSPATRSRVYDKARDTINKKLAALDPQPPEAVAQRQRQALEDAIASVEGTYAAPAPKPAPVDPLDELESVFSSIDAQRRSPPPPPSRPPAPQPAPHPSATHPPATHPMARAVEMARTVEPAPAPRLREPVPAQPAPRQAEPRRMPPASMLEESETPAPAADASAAEQPQFDEGTWRREAEAMEEEERPRRSLAGRLVAAVLVLAVLAGGFYAAWLYQDDITRLAADVTGGQDDATPSGAPPETPPGALSGDPAQGAPDAPAQPAETAAEPAAPSATQTAEQSQPEPQEPAAADVAAASPDDQPAQEPGQPAAAAPAPATPKFTQRLGADGGETDAGAGLGAESVGEGTSVAQQTVPAGAADPNAPAAPGAAQPPAQPLGGAQPGQPAVPVAQRAIFYEERTNVAPSSAETGQIVWSTVQESPGGDLPPETAIRAEATIPGKDMQLRMTIRRNGDRTLPASHIIEMIFLNSGSGTETIDNVLRVSMKNTEQDPGTPLLGNAAKIADGYFLVALDDGQAQQQANLNLLRSQGWIDVPVVYKSGRRALFTMEKGIPGEKAFNDAVTAWQGRAGG